MNEDLPIWFVDFTAVRDDYANVNLQLENNAILRTLGSCARTIPHRARTRHGFLDQIYFRENDRSERDRFYEVALRQLRSEILRPPP